MVERNQESSGIAQVPVPDSDDARRRKLLNVLLVGTAGSAFVTLLIAAIADLWGAHLEPPLAFYIGTPIVLIGTLVIAVINWKWSRRWASEEASQRSEKHFRALIENALDLIMILNGDGTIRYGSPSMERVLGYKPSEFIGRRPADFVHPDDLPAIMDAFRHVNQEPGAVRQAQFRIRHKDGAWCVFEATGSNLPDDSTIEGIVVNAHHVTERVRFEAIRQQAEQTLRLRVEQLAALSRASQVVTASLELDEVLAEIVSLATEVVGSGYTSVVLVDEEGNLGGSAENVPGVPALEYRIRDDGLTRWIVRSGKTVIVDEIRQDGEMMPCPGEGAPRLANPPIVEAGIKSLAGLPLVVKDRLLGVLYLHSLRAGAFHDQLSLLSAFANQVAIAIENARLYGAAQQELTERKRAEGALRQSEERYRRITDAITDYIYTVRVQDGKPVETTHGEACVAVTGHTADEFQSNPYLWIEMVHGEDRAAVQEQIARIVLGIAVEPLEHRILRKDRAMRWVRNTPVPHYDGEGRLMSYDGLIQDITERKQLEEQMRQQERLAAIGQLAGGIAHDFNNFLTTIMLYVQIVLRKPLLPPDLKPYLETVLDESRQAALLVRQVLDFSRRSMMEIRPVDLMACIEGTVNILQRTLPENIRLLVEIGSDECVANADPARIQQAVMNLALNARDAMPQGGELSIGLSKVEVAPGEDPPGADMPAGEWIRLTVSDTGVGMTKEVRSHLFEPFFTTKEPGKGTGLGLAQVHGIVTQHGGHVDVETALDQGTTFHVYLPAYNAAAKENVEEVADLSPGAGEIILLVEDEENVREAGRDILETLGYQTLLAANGRDALEGYQSAEHVDLVVTDLVMPEMGGGALVQALKERDPQIKVLAITGYAVAEDLEKLREAGILNVVQKPLDARTLAKAIRHALDAG